MLGEKDLERFMSFVYHEPNTGCWLHAGSPTGYKPRQYPGFQLNGEYKRAHRVSYEHFKGEIPNGLVVDHLCRQTFCVNPDHLEAVTHKENVRRGFIVALRHLWIDQPPNANSLKTHCPKGHEYSGDNLWVNNSGRRECRVCMNARKKAHSQAKRDAERLARGGPKPNGMVTYRAKFTTCPKGHEYSHHNGRQRVCKICNTENQRRYRERKRT